MKRSLFAVLLVLMTFSFAVPAAASVEAAKAAYQRGVSLERNKQYTEAIKEYQAALDASPNYFYAHKQMGTCYYYLGDKSSALAHYDAYLAKAPDAAIKSLADKMRAAGVTPASASGSAASSSEAGGPSNNLYTNLGSLALAVFNAGYSRAISDHNAGVVEAALLSLKIGSTNYSMTGVGLGWHFSTRRLAGWFIGPKLNYFTVSATDTSTPGVTLSASGSELGIGGEGGYQWRWGNGLTLNWLLCVQSVSINVAAYASSSGGSASATGSYSGILPTSALNLGYAF
ncbi:MAG: tetratricopeptide repeat protein [candidate division FCPU426 bacterium]